MTLVQTSDATIRSSPTINERQIYTVAFALFAVAAGFTLYFVRSMRGGMPMAGGWTMSMMWMSMPNEAWIQAAVVFLAMWLAMMVAMMLPSTLPMLLLYRRTLLSRHTRHPDGLMWTAAAGYFLVWSIFGAAVYVLGMALARSTMLSPAISRAVPLLSGGALMLAGMYQLTAWKFACLQHCRNPIFALAHYQRASSPREWERAFRLGFHHGAFCTGCCWALMLIQLTLGVMNITAMVAVAAIIAFEKLFPRGASVARVVGVGALTAGFIVALRALA